MNDENKISENIPTLLNTAIEQLKIITMLRAQLDIAKEGLVAIEESGETNIATKTLIELGFKPE
jgi:hypothetical protein